MMSLTNIISETIVTPDDWGASDIYRGSIQPRSQSRTDVMEEAKNRFEEAKNLYIVGGGTHPGSGLPTILKVQE